jgi:hypothetical protein
MLFNESTGDKDVSTNELYAKYLQFTNLMLEDYDAMQIAAIMTIQGLSLYRTCMKEEDYQKMVKSIYDRRDEVNTFE